MKGASAAIAALVLVVGAFGAGVWWTTPKAPATAVRTLTLAPGALEARAAILYDLNTGQVLYQKDAQEPLPLASLTKLMTAAAVLGSQNPATEVEITQADLTPEGDWGLRPGDVLSIKDLLKLGLVASSNDAMAAAANSLGGGYLAAMNAAAQDLSLTKTRFNNSTGLDLSSDNAGAYGSAFDVARLTAAFYQKYPSVFSLTTADAVSVVDGSRMLSFGATSAPLHDIPGFVGAKTGYTDLAGGNLSAIFDLDVGRPVAAVVLGSTESGRFADVRTLIDAAREQHL